MPNASRINGKPRNAWLAGLLSLLVAGLGQAYCGQWKRGLILFFVTMVLGLSSILLLATASGMLALVCLAIAVQIGIIADAVRLARNSGDYALKRYNRGWVYLLAFVGSLAVNGALTSYITGDFYKAYKIPSGSMMRTLLVGDHLIAKRLSGIDSIERGDIVIFLMPDKERNYVKRVVGLPGETVSIVDKVVHIDGRPLDEPYVQHTEKDTVPRRDEFPAYPLEDGMYFLMGDNREGSNDSRFFGPIRRDDILARAIYIYLPGSVASGKRWERLGRRLD